MRSRRFFFLWAVFNRDGGDLFYDPIFLKNCLEKLAYRGHATFYRAIELKYRVINFSLSRDYLIII